MPGLAANLASRRRQLLVALLLGGLTLSATQAAPPSKRARPPKFTRSVEDVFFPNASEKLVGPRPTVGSTAPVVGKPTTATLPEVTDASATDKWSQLITAADVEDEIKAQQHKLADSVQNATQFKAGQYKQAREQLSMLAAMLAIVAEYDGSIRWKRDAAALRDGFGRAGFNCKVASDASHAEALARSEDLQSLIRGESIDLPPPQDAVDWPRIADRPSLMKRLEQGHQLAILPSVASPREFEQNADRLLHEAQVMAALSEVITRSGYEFADDETYVQLARAMRKQALALRDAVRQNNYEQVRHSAGQLGQSCTNCHEGYRS